MTTCSSCGAALAAGDRFCQSCGAPASIARTCPGCGGSVGPEAAFCGRCGSAVGAVAALAPAAYAPPSPAVSYAAPPPPVEWLAQPTEVKPKLRYRGVVIRFVAALIDSILYLAVAFVLAGSTGLGTTSNSGFDLNGGPSLMLSLASFAYFVLFEGLFGGTIGKLVLGLRVVNWKGRAPGVGAALVRNLLRIVDFLPLLYAVGVIAVLASEKKQRIGDRVAGTYVIAR